MFIPSGLSSLVRQNSNKVTMNSFLIKLGEWIFILKDSVKQLHVSLDTPGLLSWQLQSATISHDATEIRRRGETCFVIVCSLLLLPSFVFIHYFFLLINSFTHLYNFIFSICKLNLFLLSPSENQEQQALCMFIRQSFFYPKPIW
jgi:accessory gene regulator protein AgrB